MPTLAPTSTEADRAAERNFNCNRAALAASQPRLPVVLSEVLLDLEWVYGREGYLTAFRAAERWYSGCSVPLLAARAMLRSLEPGSGVGCLLNPVHAAQVRVALDQHGKHNALICLAPDLASLAILLHCDDFSVDIARGRLWFAWGEEWTGELGRLLEEQPGLPTPSRFIRLPNTDPAVADACIKQAQQVFSEESTRRNAVIAEQRARWRSGQQSICVIAASAFRLWDDAGDTLFTTLNAGLPSELRVQRFDPDTPAASSPLALANAVAAADVVIAADVFRADAQTITPTDQPWITWVTTPRIPSVQSAGPNDRLLLADQTWRELAVKAGWPDERISVATWPMVAVDDQTSGAELRLAIIADTAPLDPPESLAGFSSHGLLWEKVRRHVLAEPLALPHDLDRWLCAQARAEGIDPRQLDVPLFLNRLVIPAYQHALAAVLLDAGLPLVLHGAGWDELPPFRAHAAGPVTTREELVRTASLAGALVHVWPGTAAHAIEALARPVVRATGRRKETFVREAKLALHGQSTSRPAQLASIPPLSALSVLRI